MNAKEKAQELFNKMYEFAIFDEGAKHCALIAVDEMIVQNGELYLIGLDGDYYRQKNAFLFEVKQEIEKL